MPPTPDGQLLSTLMDTHLPSKYCGDLPRLLCPLQHWSLLPLQALGECDISPWDFLADYSGKVLNVIAKNELSRKRKRAKLKAVWAAPCHIAGGVDFVLRHHAKTVMQMVANAPTDTMKLYGYIFRCYHPDYGHFSPFANGKLRRTESFALPFSPARPFGH